MTVELRKLSVLEWVAKLSDERIINELYKSITVKYKSGSAFDMSNSRRYAQVKNTKFDLEAIKENQGYNGVNEQRMDELIAQLDIEQSIEDLLKDLD